MKNKLSDLDLATIDIYQELAFEKKGIIKMPLYDDNEQKGFVENGFVEFYQLNNFLISILMDRCDGYSQNPYYLYAIDMFNVLSNKNFEENIIEIASGYYEVTFNFWGNEEVTNYEHNVQSWFINELCEKGLETFNKITQVNFSKDDFCLFFKQAKSKTLTKEQAFKENKKMWEYLADIIKKSQRVIQIDFHKREYLSLSDFSNCLYMDCFLCEYYSQQHNSTKNDWIDFWKQTEYYKLYEKCYLCNSYQEQLKYVLELANLC